MTPFQLMVEVTERFGKQGVVPYEINNGLCDEWANEVMEQLRNTDYKVELWETPFGFADTIHVFVMIDGKFHDAECLDGVEDHMQLPIFARMAEAGAKRQPVWRIDANHDGGTLEDGRRDITLEMLKEYDEQNDTNNSGLFPQNA